MTSSLQKFGLSFGIVLSFCLVINGAFATKLVHRNVAELTTLADRIFIGTCLSVEAKTLTIEGNPLLATEYTFEVVQAVKGVSGSRLVFRQFGTAAGTGSVVGMPAYQFGKKYLLFLGNESRYGLTSPVGFGQGAFLVYPDHHGSTRALNFMGNRGLFLRMDAKAQLAKGAQLSLQEEKLLVKTAGPVRVETLMSLVEKLM